MDLLDITTTLEPEKQLKQVNAAFIDAQFAQSNIQGYEIHCGVSTVNEMALVRINRTPNSKITEGAINSDNNVLGTYLHGLFDNPEASNALLTWAGLTTNQSVNLEDIREQQLERLADCLEKTLDPVFVQNLTASSVQPC